MISRAYHDTTFMSLVAPVGMIFIPCRDGVSHRPEEYASPEAHPRRGRSAGAARWPVWLVEELELSDAA